MITESVMGEESLEVGWGGLKAFASSRPPNFTLVGIVLVPSLESYKFKFEIESKNPRSMKQYVHE